jgi:hypothetical protein
MNGSRDKAARLLLWIAAGAVTGALAYQRYHGAVSGSVGGDFSIYLTAARRVAAGLSPYQPDQLYVYPPPFALLLAPFSHAAPVHLWKVWTALELGALVAGVAAFVLSVAKGLSPWLRPVLFAACAVSVLHFWPVTIGLYLGQADAFVFAVLMLSALAAGRARPGTRGVLVGLAGLLKTWPAAVALSLFQRGLERRARAIGATVLTILVAPILALALGGGSGLSAFIRAVIAARTQGLVSDSVWGAPRLLFSHSGIARPVTVSVSLQVVVTALLLAWVVGLVVLALRTAGDPQLCTWNVTFCLVLLLPVSHLAYTLYCLPVLWIWGARQLRTGRKDLAGMAVLAILLAWWLVQTRSWPDSGSSAAISSVRYSVVFIADLVACTASVVGGRLVLRSDPAVQQVDPLDPLDPMEPAGPVDRSDRGVGRSDTSADGPDNRDDRRPGGSEVDAGAGVHPAGP